MNESPSGGSIRRAAAALAFACVFTAGAAVIVPRVGRDRPGASDAADAASRPPPAALPAPETHDAPTELEPAGEPEVAVVTEEPVEAAPSIVEHASVPARPVFHSSDPRARLLEVFERANGRGSRDPARLAAEIHAIGPEVLPLVIDALCGRFEWPEIERQAGAPAPVTDDERAAALRAAFVTFEAAARIDSIARATTLVEVGERRMLAELLGETGDASAVRPLLALLGGFDPIDLRREFVQQPITSAVIGLVAADPRAVGELDEELSRLPVEVACSIVRGCLRSSRLEAIRLASRQLGTSAELDATILEDLALPRTPARAALDADATGKIIALAASSDPRTRRAACAALGNAHADVAIEELVERLDDSDPRVGAAARSSLRTLTGRNAGATRQDWEGWLAERERWHAERLPVLTESLSSSDSAVVVGAINGLLQRRDAASSVVELLEPLLAAEDSSVFERAAGALEAIGSARAIAVLTSALADASGARRNTLSASVLRLTGESPQGLGSVETR